MSVAWVLARGERGYPACLEELADRAPARLYGLGRRDLVRDLDPAGAVTIVGARRASGYGRGVARELGFGAGAAGLVVVSGMALGCDSAAHEGALDARGATIAVLGSGPDVPSPASRRGLHRRILSLGGAVVSESEPGTEPSRGCFPRRNRIMAALAATSVVVEATVRSGTRYTTDEAQDLGREVGAVPGPVTSALSDLPNELLHQGAGVIRDAQDLLDLRLGVGERSVRGVGPVLEPALCEALRAVEQGAASCDAVASAVGLDGFAAAVALSRLELMGYVRGDAVGRYARTPLRAPDPAA